MTETFAFIVDSTVKPKDANQTSISTKTNNGTSKDVISSRSESEKNIYVASAKTNRNVVSVLKSDTVSVLKADDHLDDFFGDGNKLFANDSSIHLDDDDFDLIAENTVR